MLKEVSSIYDEVADEKYVGTKFLAIQHKKTTTMDMPSIEKLINCGRDFYRLGWAPAYNDTGSSGNLGFRGDSYIAVTATNKKLGELVPEDIIKVIDVDYSTDPPTVHYESDDDRKPTSEVLAHWQLFKKRKDGAVILHGHDKLTTRTASLISRYSPNLVARTKEAHPYGTKYFADALEEVAEDRSYLVAKSHGFFSLGNDFDEALFYASWIHFFTYTSGPYFKLRYSKFVDSKIPSFLDGMVSSATDRLEGLLKIVAKTKVKKTAKLLNWAMGVLGI